MVKNTLIKESINGGSDPRQKCKMNVETEGQEKNFKAVKIKLSYLLRALKNLIN